MKKQCTMREALEREDLLGTILPGSSWRAWRILLIAAMGEKLTWLERQTFKKLTGRSREPGQMVDTFEAVVGRRGGKTRAAATLACYTAALIDYSDVQAIGERLKVLCLARDQKQAGVAFNYIAGIFEAVPLLREMMVNRTVDTISLPGVDIEVKTASASGLRGFTCVSVIADEAAFWQTDSASANADTEILNAVRPSLATTGGPLLILSSPHAAKAKCSTFGIGTSARKAILAFWFVMVPAEISTAVCRRASLIVLWHAIRSRRGRNSSASSVPN